MRQCSNPACLQPIDWNKQPEIDHHGDHVDVYCSLACCTARSRAEPKRRINWLFVLGFLVVLGVAFKAWGAPPEGSDLRDRDFFNALTAPNGAGCCTEADCRYIENEDWRIKDGHFEVFIESAWIPVPKEKVLDRNKSPRGKPVLCRRGTTIYCFAPDVLT